ncbi:F0F1 ATP synthase subunit B [Vagococcus lutrae]|uniref:F0F1 ATP synthase subunit B n=1 Tax=Vagococcus lutrae TaxID=81947 RepID=UPI001443B9D3|nr:F0F1 ATP synthase subunit B [Vagococcus lutrae]NKZ28407.1 F0F1 ATP synthase subunit B [Vagococcus lutrae]
MTDYLVIASAANTTITTMAFVTLSFIILMLLIKKFAWGPITDMLHERETKITNDIDNAEASRKRAAELVKEHEETLAKSRAEAAAIVKNAKETAELNADAIIKEAHEDMKRYREQGKKELELERTKLIESARKEVADLSISIAEKILKKELDDVTHRELIDSYIEGLGARDED